MGVRNGLCARVAALYLVMCTAPPPVLIAIPAPELAWIRLASRLRLG